MSIVITNLGRENEKGETIYALKINSRALTSFTHTRSDGLAACLLRASEAAARYEREEAVRRLEAVIKTIEGLSDGQ